MFGWRGSAIARKKAHHISVNFARAVSEVIVSKGMTGTIKSVHPLWDPNGEAGGPPSSLQMYQQVAVQKLDLRGAALQGTGDEGRRGPGETCVGAAGMEDVWYTGTSTTISGTVYAEAALEGGQCLKLSI